MTIQELMAQVDVNRVVDAFLIMDYNFSKDNYESTFFEKYEAIPGLRKAIEDNIHLFVECEAKADTKPCTIFILYNQDGEDYENKWKESFANFVIEDEEVIPVLDKDFHIFDDEGEVQVTQYSYDHIPMNEMVNYTIAETSIEKFGKEICAAKIISDIFWWGIYPEDREKKLAKLVERAEEPDVEKNTLSLDEFIEKRKQYEEELISNMSDDEKAYYLAKEKFEEETKDIVQRYWKKVNEEIQLDYIQAIRKEYSRRNETLI